MSLFVKNYSFLEVTYLLIRFDKIGSSGETHSILKEMLLINKTHTCPLKERYCWKELVSMKISDIILFKHPLPFYAENLTPPTLVNFEKSNPFCKYGRRMAVVATMSITPENVKNLWFSDVSRGYRNIRLGLNGLSIVQPPPFIKGGGGDQIFQK